MRLASLFTRRLSALLASLALVSVMARPVLACDMGKEGHQGHRVSEPAQSVDPHAHHDVAAAPGATEGSTVPSVPAVPGAACDHVVGCAVMVLPTHHCITITPIASMDATPRTADTAVDAPTLAVEPPPPRR